MALQVLDRVTDPHSKIIQYLIRLFSVLFPIQNWFSFNFGFGSQVLFADLDSDFASFSDSKLVGSPCKTAPQSSSEYFLHINH